MGKEEREGRGRGEGERVEGERVEGERAEGERAQGERAEGERGGRVGNTLTVLSDEQLKTKPELSHTTFSSLPLCPVLSPNSPVVTVPLFHIRSCATYEMSMRCSSRERGKGGMRDEKRGGVDRIFFACKTRASLYTCSWSGRDTTSSCTGDTMSFNVTSFTKKKHINKQEASKRKTEDGGRERVKAGRILSQSRG